MTTHYFRAIYAELDKDKKSLKNELIMLTIQENGDYPIPSPITSSQVLSTFSQPYFKQFDLLSKGRIRIEEINSNEANIIHDIEINQNSIILCWVISSTECWIKAKLSVGIARFKVRFNSTSDCNTCSIIMERIGILIKRSFKSSLNSILPTPDIVVDTQNTDSQEFQLIDSTETATLDQIELEQFSLSAPADHSQSQKVNPINQNQLEDWFGSNSNSNSLSETIHFDWDTTIEFEKKLILLDSQDDEADSNSLPLFLDIDQISNIDLLKLMIKEKSSIDEWNRSTKSHLPYWKERTANLFP